MIASAQIPAFFTEGEADRGEGLEALAEDGNPAALAAASGGTAFNTPDGASEPGPLLPGDSYIVEFTSAPGHYLDFATMLVQTNDWFFGPQASGIALFDEEGAPISGDITDQVVLWDAGTEVDQTPGVGPTKRRVRAALTPAMSTPTTPFASSRTFRLRARLS